MPNDPKKLLGRSTLTNLFLICSGIAFYMLLSNFSAVRAYLLTIYRVLSPFIIALVLAYLLNIPMRWFEKKIFHKCKRKRVLSLVVTYLLALLTLYALGSLVLPQLWNSLSQLVTNAQMYLDNLAVFVEDVAAQLKLDYKNIEVIQDAYADLMKKTTAVLAALMPQLLGLSISLGKGVFSTVTAVITSVYLLMDKEKLLFQTKKIIFAIAPSRKTGRILQVLAHSDQVFSGFISGKLIDSLIIGVLCFLGMSFIKPELAMLISVIIGITNIIPVFGPFIGAIPSILLLVMIDPISALWFAIFVLLLQQLDGNVIGPKILGDSTGLSALWVLIAIVVGGGLFGVPGMLVGVPLFSVLYFLGSDALQTRLSRKGILAKDGQFYELDLSNLVEDDTPLPTQEDNKK